MIVRFMLSTGRLRNESTLQVELENLTSRGKFESAPVKSVLKDGTDGGLHSEERRR